MENVYEKTHSKKYVTLTQPSLCGIAPCSTIEERSIHLNTNYCLETGKQMLDFCP